MDEVDNMEKRQWKAQQIELDRKHEFRYVVLVGVIIIAVVGTIGGLLFAGHYIKQSSNAHACVRFGYEQGMEYGAQRCAVERIQVYHD